jgi:hypothetical protein
MSHAYDPSANALAACTLCRRLVWAEDGELRNVSPADRGWVLILLGPDRTGEDNRFEPPYLGDHPCWLPEQPPLRRFYSEP